MKVYRPHRATHEELLEFHTEGYLSFLKECNPGNVNDHTAGCRNYIAGDDCPMFDGVYKYCQSYTGGTLEGAQKLINGEADIAINWAGGLHHARKEEASGFCYVNDIVLGILELLKYHPRVLYIDIDIHHGDGVQDAFYNTDRVMCVSFHKYGGGFFPGTGDIEETGMGRGKNYSLNVPLSDGVDDHMYVELFRDVIGKVMRFYRPTAVVFQSGADSLQCDRLGCFNLTLKGHAKCLAFVKNYGLPTLLVGGGGYTIKNVARCWTYETSVCLDTELENDLPFNEYLAFFGPDFRLHPPPQPLYSNQNTRRDIEDIKRNIAETLRSLDCAPSVQMRQLPSEAFQSSFLQTMESGDAPDIRIPEQDDDNYVQHEAEFYEDEADNDGEPAGF
eukprot:CAMPEP_0119126024 /NCGR_PEP_ID=MMETSP1310-20130426/5095_1 /TAXON_ID=464262 /ORGANISM="Genus nov. species nov., Strain RCC2339" /LENGTH=388 /DNA_ID=CAMNT_0007116147 /DNA_START=220 /DNA_END=1386 /DNA_ORIENTATION=-